MLKHAEAVHELECVEAKRKPIDVGLEDVEATIEPEVLPAGVHSRGIVDGDKPCARCERDLRESSGATADVECPAPIEILRLPSRLRKEPPARDRLAREAVELRPPEPGPLEGEAAGVVFGDEAWHEADDGE